MVIIALDGGIRSLRQWKSVLNHPHLAKMILYPSSKSVTTVELNVLRLEYILQQPINKCVHSSIK